MFRMLQNGVRLSIFTIILIACFFVPVSGQSTSGMNDDIWRKDILAARMTNRLMVGSWVQKCQLSRMLVDYGAGDVHVSGVDPDVVANQNKNIIDITEQDFDEFQKHKVDRIVIHGGVWSLCGSFEPFDVDDMNRVREECRKRDIDFLLYVSTGYVDRRSIAYTELGKDESWTQPGWRVKAEQTHFAQGALWDCVSGCVGSVEWRSWFLSSLDKAIDEWDLDGVYIDPGQYHIGSGRNCDNPNHIHPADDFEYIRLLAEVREIFNRHGGGTIILYDKRGLDPHHEKLWQYADYWLVGERYTLKEISQCVRPDVYTSIWPDTRIMGRGDYLYAVGLPRLQFPVMHLGELDFPGISPEERKLWLYYLDLYRPVTKPGTEAFLGVSKSSIFKEMPDSTETYVSFFVNEDIYVVIGNQANRPLTLEFTVPFEDLRNNKVSQHHKIAPKSPGIYRWTGKRLPVSEGIGSGMGAGASGVKSF